MRRAIESILAPVASFERIRPFLRRRLTSVFGHLVSDAPNPFTAEIYRYPSVSEFRGTLAFLQEHFTVVGLDAVVRHARDGAPLPDYPLFLSFDDGLRECAEVVAPILKEMKLPATFFLTARALDNRYLFYGHRRSYLLHRLRTAPPPLQERSVLGALLGLSAPDPTPESLGAALRGLSIHAATDCLKIDECAVALGIVWQDLLAQEQPFMTRTQAAALQADGFAIGAHGMDHTKFAFLDEARRTQDLAQSLEFVADKFSLDQVAFCFPHSHEGVPEAWMADRLADEPRLSIFLTTAGYAPNNAAAVNRVGLDRPLGDPGPLDPGRILARAFLHAAVHRGAWRRPPEKSR